MVYENILSPYRSGYSGLDVFQLAILQSTSGSTLLCVSIHLATFNIHYFLEQFVNAGFNSFTNVVFYILSTMCYMHMSEENFSSFDINNNRTSTFH